jgi:CBS domain-containing protein
MQISTILATKGSTVVTVRPNQTVREAVALLVEKHIGAVVVIDEAGHPVGIVSERDIMRLIAQNDKALNEPVHRVMTHKVIISIGDVVKAQLDEYEGEIETLQTRVEKG